jgi:hypothetical protein
MEYIRNNIVPEILDFVCYIDNFYNEKSGIYPIKGLTNDIIIDAIKKYIASLSASVTWGGGDSLDRERVSNIILADYDVAWTAKSSLPTITINMSDLIDRDTH